MPLRAIRLFFEFQQGNVQVDLLSGGAAQGERLLVHAPPKVAFQHDRGIDFRLHQRNIELREITFVCQTKLLKKRCTITPAFFELFARFSETL